VYGPVHVPIDTFEHVVHVVFGVRIEVSERVGKVVADRVVVCFDFCLGGFGLRMCIVIGWCL
jgi:hypothetical protein